MRKIQFTKFKRLKKSIKMASKKEFILEVTQALQESPRAILAGHKIKGGVLQMITGRPDIMSKLASALYTTKYARKGAKGLRKSQNLWVKAYKNFPMFNANARVDVENFIEQLDEKDQNVFSNADNVLVFLALPDKDIENTPETLEGDIISGKSIGLNFESAVKKEYKVAGGFYIIVMIADSIVRPPEAAVAKRKEKVNARKQKKRTPSKIKAELKSKAAKKLEKLDSELETLEGTKAKIENQISQFQKVGEEFGVKGGLKGTRAWRTENAIAKADKTAAGLKAKFDKVMNNITPEAQEDIKLAIKLAKRGKLKQAKSLLKGVVLSPKRREIIEEGVLNPSIFEGGSAKVAARRKAAKEKLTALTARSQVLLDKLQTAPAEKKASIRSMISKNNAEAKKIRLSLGTYRNITKDGYRKKSQLLKQINADIANNLKKGNSVRQALNNAISALTATNAEKQLINEQVLSQVAEGMPLQYATQQAVQNLQIPEAIDNELNAVEGNGLDDIINSIDDNLIGAGGGINAGADIIADEEFIEDGIINDIEDEILDDEILDDETVTDDEEEIVTDDLNPDTTILSGNRSLSEILDML
jgi:hypothetical protein